MAINFNGAGGSPGGAGTSILQNADADLDLAATGEVTILAWAFAGGIGENSNGHIIAMHEAGTAGYSLSHTASADTMQLKVDWTTDGTWTFPATDGQWNPIAVTYSNSATTNDPIARVGFTNVTVTETLTPTGSPAAVQTGYCAGNTSLINRTWGGGLAHIQVFNRALTPDECDAALRKPGSIKNGLKLWLPMWDANSIEDLSGNGFNATVTAALGARTDGPPCGHVWGSYDDAIVITSASSPQNVNLTGIASTEAFGTSTFTLGNVNVNLTSIASAEAFGTPTFTLGNVNLSLTGISSSEVFGTVTFVTEAIAGTPTTPWTSVQTVLGALYAKMPELTLGFQFENIKFPYVTLNKLSTTLNTLNTCLARLEDSAYTFTVYALSYDEVFDKLEEIESLYDYGTFQNTNRHFVSMLWTSQVIRETEPGIFQGLMNLEVTTEKRFSNQYQNLSPTSGKNIAACFYKRWLENPDLFGDAQLYPSSFAAERQRRPYIVLPELQGTELWVHTQGRIENQSLELTAYGNSCFETEILNEAIMYTYDYAKFILPGKRFTNLEWLSDTVEEIEPGIWRGSVGYNVLLEKSIANG